MNGLRRTTTIPIYFGDDLERMAELRQALAVAEEKVRLAKLSARIGDAESADAERDAYESFVREAAGRAVGVTLMALGSKRFRDLMREHPPRMVEVDGAVEVHEDDQPYGVNVETFPTELLAYRDPSNGERRTITAPDFPTRESAREFIEDDIDDGDFERLWVASFWLNKAVGTDPKALLSSTTTLTET